MSTWPERPDGGDCPVVWVGEVCPRPSDPEVGDIWDAIDGRRYIWTGSEWVPERFKRTRP